MRNKFSTRKKIFAVLASGLVLGIGGTMTLASWTDTEWAQGGNGTAAGVGTSTFSVDQNADNPFSTTTSTFTNHATAATANPLSFSMGALTLTPGDTIYAPVALTNSAASVGGNLVLQTGAVSTLATINDTGSLLSSALHLSIGEIVTPASVAPPTCDLAGYGGFTPIQTDSVGLFTTHTATTEVLPAAGTKVAHYCFKITLPTDSLANLQGRTTAPVWQFIATSN